MNATAGDCIFIPCYVYIPAEPPLMGLESLKMCFSRPVKLLAGRICRDLCIFDAAWGGVELWKGCMTYLESRGIQTTRHATKGEKYFSHSLSLCQKDVCKVGCSAFLPDGVSEQGIWYIHAVNLSQRVSCLSLLTLLCILLYGLHLSLSPFRLFYLKDSVMKCFLTSCKTSTPQSTEMASGLLTQMHWTNCSFCPLLKEKCNFLCDMDLYTN